MEPIDARGKSCPLPIVLLAKALRGADFGTQVTVLADDRAFPEDVQAWCAKTGNELTKLDRSAQGTFEATVVRLK